MQYWLIKSEPETYSIDDLQNESTQQACWDGVRNYQARNFMRDKMKIGDQVFYYHSNCKQPGIVGTVEVASNSYPDETAFDLDSEYFDPKSSREQPRWFLVDFKFKQKFSRVITLTEMKQNPKLQDMQLLQRGNRLSILPLTKKQWQEIHSML